MTTTSTDRIRQKKQRFLEREQLIKDTTLGLLVRDGVEKVTVSAIATEAGIGKGTVYKHFQSKAEIMMRIVSDYEQVLVSNVKAGIKATENGDPGAAAKAYFDSRLANPALDRLVQQLEFRLEDDESVATEMARLHKIRHSMVETLNNMVSKLIERGLLEDVPPHYHYLACWALAQGAVDVCFNQGFADQFEDKEKLLNFIANIGVTMGNRGQYREY
ncbi:MAG: TetR/AcrR family transcriptional regulator [Candidatus Reddybacter sp.]